MGATPRLPRRLHRIVDEDRGTSLTELIVGMLVMGIFMAVFTGTVVSMARTTTKVEAVASSADQVNDGFLALDKLVRYAAAITTVGPATGSSGDWYVELDLVDNSTAAVVETCTQLRVDVAAQQLQVRTWTALTPTTYSSLSGWSVLASQVVNGNAAPGSADLPFTVPPALSAASTTCQRLTITLVAGTSGPSSSSTTRSSMTFTAVNSVASDAGNAGKCHQLPTGSYRP
jgi:Tfp pilus assembly protein PilW